MHVQVYQVGDCSTDRTCSKERSVVRCSDKALVHLVPVENCAWWRHRAAPGLEGQPRGGGVPSLQGGLEECLDDNWERMIMQLVQVAECTDSAANFKVLEGASRSNCVQGMPLEAGEPGQHSSRCTHPD